jgi:GNAT superfamily N-acetyltransferase
MKVTFQVEPWGRILPEIKPMAHLLWDDVAVDKDRFVAKIWEARYAELDLLNMIHVTTARDGKRLVGFYVVFITQNGHYEGAGQMAFTDAYYLLPEYRIGNIGMKLFAFAEKKWRECGCVKAYSSHKLHRDRSAMLEALGWKPSDLIYTKVLD